MPLHQPKSIRFRDEIEVVEVERFSDHCESGDLWYSEAEYFAIERENLKISWQRMNNKLMDDEQQTVRGLELEVDSSVARRRHENEDRAFDAVMAEQDYQDRHGVYDPYAIAEAYQKNGAQQSQLEAYAVGLMDSQGVMMENSQQQVCKFEDVLKAAGLKQLMRCTPTKIGRNHSSLQTHIACAA